MYATHADKHFQISVKDAAFHNIGRSDEASVEEKKEERQKEKAKVHSGHATTTPQTHTETSPRHSLPPFLPVAALIFFSFLFPTK